MQVMLMQVVHMQVMLMQVVLMQEPARSQSLWRAQAL